MATITSHGLALEQSVLTTLAKTYLDRLTGRGVTEDKLAEYDAAKTDMETKRAIAYSEKSGSRQLSEEETAARASLHDNCRRIQRAAHLVFPAGGPQQSEFHIGDNIDQSVSVSIGHGRDIAAAALKYKEKLIAEGGLIARDLAELDAAILVMDATNASHELALRKNAPEAFAALDEAKTRVQKIADFIHTAANAEFLSEPDVLDQFAKAKKLRYTADPRVPKPTPEPPAPQN